MMRHYGNFGGGGLAAQELICSIILIVVMIDLVLVGVWLWKQINKHN